MPAILPSFKIDSDSQLSHHFARHQVNWILAEDQLRSKGEQVCALAMAQKRLPRSHDDIAADFFALRKNFVGGRWVFTESRNLHNPASHCDIAWAGALASEAHNLRRSGGLTSALE